MPPRKDEWYRQKACNILAHAIWHCEFGSEDYIRTPDAGDLAAAAVLRECIKEVTREDIERDIIEGRT